MAWISGELPLSSPFPLALCLIQTSNSQSPARPPGSPGEASLGKQAHVYVARLPPGRCRALWGTSFLAPPLRATPESPPPYRTGPGGLPSRPAPFLLPISSLLHRCHTLAAPCRQSPSSCMGELSFPSSTSHSDVLDSLERGPLFSPGFGGSGLLGFSFLLCGDGTLPSKPSALLRECWGLEQQLPGSRRGKQTPETLFSAGSRLPHALMGLAMGLKT